MPLNEAETRYELIDPFLREKGYRMPYITLETKAPVEPIGHKGRRRAGAGRTDYLLCVETRAGPMPLPVAILEAKKEDEDPLKGMQQAKGYSDCDRFDAKYIFSTNGHRYAKFNKFSLALSWRTRRQPNSKSPAPEVSGTRSPNSLISSRRSASSPVALLKSCDANPA